MAVKFDDIMKVDAGETVYAAIVKEIDSTLVRAAKYGGLSAHVISDPRNQSEGTIKVSFTGVITPSIKNRLDRDYTLAGWKVKQIETDSRGQGFIEFYIKF